MRLCEQCHMAQFNGKWHSSNQRNLFLLGVCFNNLKYKSIAISTNSATWHCSKTQVLCRFEPNSAIFPSSALGQLWVGPLRPLRGHSRLPARSSAERCPLGTSAPQRGRRDLAPPSGAATSRWDVAQRPVSAAASVGAGRLPLADSTRGGSRVAGAVRRLRGQAASLTGRSRGYHLAEGAFSVCTRPGKTLRCFPSFFSGYRPLRSRARSKLF